MTDNPFRIGVAVRGALFTDRADEATRVADTLREGGARLLVVGERRTGKTSVLLRGIERVHRSGGHAFLVDCGTAGSAIEIANRVLSAATRALGRDWVATVGDLTKRTRGRIQLSSDAAGSPTVSFEPTVASDPSAQHEALATVLDALDARANATSASSGSHSMRSSGSRSFLAASRASGSFEDCSSTTSTWHTCWRGLSRPFS